jgi:CRISPR-associated endonuclease/helicase Cas3
LLGWWHDLGKYSEAFQDYLDSSVASEDDTQQMEIPGKVDHSTAGAQHAARLGKLGQLLAYCIAGHHAGLPDNVGGDSSLSMRLKKRVEPVGAAPADLLKMPLPRPPKLRLPARERGLKRAVGVEARAAAAFKSRHKASPSRRLFPALSC